MNKILNIILSGLLWRQYKFLIVSLVLLIVSVFVIGQVHDDYLAYAQSTIESGGEGPNVGLSFIIKWGLWILAFSLFIFSNHLANARKEKQKAEQGSNKTLRTLLSFKRNKTPEPAIQKPVKTSKPNSSDDPFAHLRAKEKLRSYADLVIETHEEKEKKK